MFMIREAQDTLSERILHELKDMRQTRTVHQPEYGWELLLEASSAAYVSS